MNYDGAVLCAVPDHFGRGALNQWPQGRLVTWALGAFRLPGLTVSDCEAATQEALERWSRVSGFRHQKASGRTADITINTGAIDGQSGTLAWMELPPGEGATRPLKGLVDTSEDWVISDNPPSHKIDLIRVLCHELGHALGISHIEAGNLMAPTYSSAISRPQFGDITQVRARYGLPVEPKPNPNPPTDPSPELPGSNACTCLADTAKAFGVPTDKAESLARAGRVFLVQIGQVMPFVVEKLRR